MSLCYVISFAIMPSTMSLVMSVHLINTSYDSTISKDSTIYTQ